MYDQAEAEKRRLYALLIKAIADLNLLREEAPRTFDHMFMSPFESSAALLQAAGVAKSVWPFPKFSRLWFGRLKSAVLGQVVEFLVRFGAKSRVITVDALQVLGSKPVFVSTHCRVSTDKQLLRTALESKRFDRVILDEALFNFLELIGHAGLPLASVEPFVPKVYRDDDAEVEVLDFSDLFESLALNGFGTFVEGNFQWSETIDLPMILACVDRGPGRDFMTNARVHAQSLFENRPSDFDEQLRAKLGKEVHGTLQNACVQHLTCGRWKQEFEVGDFHCRPAFNPVPIALAEILLSYTITLFEPPDTQVALDD